MDNEIFMKIIILLFARPLFVPRNREAIGASFGYLCSFFSTNSDDRIADYLTYMVQLDQIDKVEDHQQLKELCYYVFIDGVGAFGESSITKCRNEGVVV